MVWWNIEISVNHLNTHFVYVLFWSVKYMCIAYHVFINISAGRISFEDIQKALQALRAEKLKVYMCGPSPMIHDMEEHCFSCQITKEQIFYERWW